MNYLFENELEEVLLLQFEGKNIMPYCQEENFAYWFAANHSNRTRLDCLPSGPHAKAMIVENAINNGCELLGLMVKDGQGFGMILEKIIIEEQNQ